MTKDEKIEILEKEKAYMLSHGGDRQVIALDAAIKALEQEPCEDAISRQATVDFLENHAETYEDVRVKMGFKASASLINNRNNLPPVTPQEPRWIRVSERLPEWDIECLVTDEDGEYGVGYYREDVHAWDSPNWGWLERKDRVDNKEAFTEPCGIGKVVAWMPLPKPYRKV